MNWSNLKAGISDVVKENNNQEITGANLQNVLITIVNSLGANATYGGIAHPNTSPGTPDGPVFWIASEPGVYSNFGNTEIDNTGIFTWNGISWSFEELDFGDNIEIIDNLITNDPTKVLSAKQGKELNDRLEPVESALDISSSSEVVTERISFGQHIGYIGSNAITTQTTGYYRYSDPIFLKAGESLKIKAITPTNVGRLASCDSQGGSVSRLLVGQSAATSSASNAYENTYTATSDIYLIVGWHSEYFGLELTKTYTKVTTTSKVDDIDILNDVLDVETEIKTTTADVTMTTKVGSYGGTIVDKVCSYNPRYSQYTCSEDFLVKKGETLHITAKNVATNVALLVVLDGTNHRNVIIGNGSSQTVSYTAPLDGYYAVSWLTSQGVTITKTSTSTTSDSERLDTIEQATAQIPALADSVEDLDEAVFNDATDGLTSGLVEGKYINHNGIVMTNSSFAYKEFPVRAGAVVQFTANVHQNIAAIAKKIPHTDAYEELVPATQQTVQSFTYTATENMTIAVSFFSGSSTTHTISIHTQNVKSNTLDIENIYNKIDVTHHVDFGRMFDKIAVIGDSLASGRVEGIAGESDAVGADFYHFSWLAFLAKRWRCEAYKNYSSAGANTASWLHRWLPVMQADATVYDAYFIALGTNNEYNESNPSGDQENYEAFIDRYNDIIDAVRTKAPHAVIFIMSLYQKRAGNATLEDIAETRMTTDDGVFYLDYANKAEYFRYSPEVNWRGHFSSTGYAYVAEAINEIVNDVVWENQMEEFWQQFAKYHNGD